MANTMNKTIRAAREHNARARINLKLANENLRDIFQALAYLDTPSLSDPRGWYLRVCGVCWLWRDVALHSLDLWARNAGSFISQQMTNLMIQRASAYPALDLNGHFEDHEGPGYVLTDYQMSLIETHVARLRSLVHDDYTTWSELFCRLRSFPRLETARIWDDSELDTWSELIDAPRLECLYLNNTVIPFNAPKLRYLRVDMDNPEWRRDRDIFGSYDEPAPENDEPISGVFPTRELIALLQHSPGLERLIITDMSPLLAAQLPDASQLHADLGHLRGLYLGGKSRAMADLRQRLIVPTDAQVFIDADYLDHELDLKSELLEIAGDVMISPVFDSLRLGMTPSYDLMIQLWSSDLSDTPGLELRRALELTAVPTLGPTFTLKLPFAPRELLETFTDQVIDDSYIKVESLKDPFRRFQNDVANEYHRRATDFLQFLSPSSLKHVDISDVPFLEQDNSRGYAKRDAPVTRLLHLTESSHLPRRDVILNWTQFSRMLAHAGPYIRSRGLDYLPNTPFELTLLDFPCAAFPSPKRHDEQFNADAWDRLFKFFEPYFSTNRIYQGHILKLTLAESASEMSNMDRSEELEYEHAITGSYESAVRTVTEKGYRCIARFVLDFEDLRVNTWP